MSTARTFRGLLCVGLLFCAGAAAAQGGDSPSVDSPGVDSAGVQQEIKLGNAALHFGRYEEARKHFANASRLSGMTSAEAYRGLAWAELRLGNFKAAQENAGKALQLSSTDRERAEAHNLAGTALLQDFIESHHKDDLGAAVEQFQQAVKLDSKLDVAYFNLGTALVTSGRSAEGVAAFKKYLEVTPDGPLSGRVRRYIARPSLVQAVLAPDFRLTNADGQSISSDSLRGRFVLLDFWATWCPPCLAALPTLRGLSAELPSGRFALISVDEDSSQPVWRKFITRQQMHWSQCWDDNGVVYHSFGFAAVGDLSLPRYVLLDGDGVILQVFDGYDRPAKIADAVRHAVAGSETGQP